MKDIEKLKDYREKYKRYFGIDFGKEYAIHHIDGDHSNTVLSYKGAVTNGSKWN